MRMPKYNGAHYIGEIVTRKGKQYRIVDITFWYSMFFFSLQALDENDINSHRGFEMTVSELRIDKE